VTDDDKEIETIYGHRFKYGEIRKAMCGEPFTMELVGEEADAVRRSLQVGIDAHLEICNSPERGDKYTEVIRPIVGIRALNCVVSVESLPTLMRRLVEDFDKQHPNYNDYDGDDGDDDARCLVTDIMTVLGFDENGKFVGREALGLV